MSVSSVNQKPNASTPNALVKPIPAKPTPNTPAVTARTTATLNVNGKSYAITSSLDTPLLWVLRDELGLTGTKFGCGIELCGACTVLINGSPEKACDMSVSEVAGRSITTIEGLSPTRTHAVQRAWMDLQVPQCGYCQSGMILVAVALLQSTPNPTDAQIDSAMNNLCVCGTYQRVRAAVHKAALG